MKIKRWDTQKTIFELECDSMTELVVEAIKAEVSLHYADLRYADLRSANLRSTDLSSADLRYTDLYSADLRSADLSSAILRYAILRSAYLRSADLYSADLRSADLRYTNLSSANLRYTDLRSANLRNTIGNKLEIKSMQLDTYNIVLDLKNNVMAIGCRQYTIDEWDNFSDEEITNMDENALVWWKKWKDFIFQAIKLSE